MLAVEVDDVEKCVTSRPSIAAKIIGPLVDRKTSFKVFDDMSTFSGIASPR
jgi:hypothetical protein